MITRRRFAFWLGFGLFSLGAKFGIDRLDKWAAAAMRCTERAGTAAPPNAPTAKPVHWRADHDKTWRWFEREEFIAGKWKVTGITNPVHKKTGQRKPPHDDYLDDSLVPHEMQRNAETLNAKEATHESVELAEPQPSAERRARHGRPPSEWLRSLNADEIRIWLKTIDVPEAGVSGMTYWTHLTRDHSFDPQKIEGLTVPEQAKLHAAAHYGY